jgi:hypothetical protein
MKRREKNKRKTEEEGKRAPTKISAHLKILDWKG